ncbi:hypothetical protein EMIT0324P_10258 [Pseudomonas chlororaphis]
MIQELIYAEKLEELLTDNKASFLLCLNRVQHPDIFEDLRKSSDNFVILPPRPPLFALNPTNKNTSLWTLPMTASSTRS